MRHHPDVRLLCSKAYFKRVREARRGLDAAIAHLEAQQSLLEPMGMTIGDIIHGGAVITFEDRVIDLSGMLADYGDALSEYAAMQGEAEDVMASASNERGKDAIRLYYLDGFTMVDVARKCYAARSTVTAWRDAALIECYDGLSEEWKRILPNAEVM